MIDCSRIGIYEYVKNILTSVTENVYPMNKVQELTESDTEDGFIIVRVGDLYDASEFKGSTYAAARVFVECYVPPITRGRLDIEKYTKFENDVNAAISRAAERDNEGTYWIDEDDFISSDFGEYSNSNNVYYVFAKSFIVVVGAEQQNN